MSEEEERKAAALQRYEHVAETLRKRIGPPLSELDDGNEFGELSNLLQTIQAGNPSESLTAIRIVRHWLKLKEHEAVWAARLAGLRWQEISDEIGIPVDTLRNVHHNPFDPSDTRDS